jgi:hypothetical protein
MTTWKGERDQVIDLWLDVNVDEDGKYGSGPVLDYEVR